MDRNIASIAVCQVQDQGVDVNLDGDPAGHRRLVPDSCPGVRRGRALLPCHAALVVTMKGLHEALLGVACE